MMMMKNMTLRQLRVRVFSTKNRSSAFDRVGAPLADKLTDQDKEEIRKIDKALFVVGKTGRQYRNPFKAYESMPEFRIRLFHPHINKVRREFGLDDADFDPIAPIAVNNAIYSDKLENVGGVVSAKWSGGYNFSARVTAIHEGDDPNDDKADEIAQMEKGNTWQKFLYGPDRPKEAQGIYDPSTIEEAYYDLEFNRMYFHWEADDPRLIRDRVPHSLVWGGLPYSSFSHSVDLRTLMENVEVMWPFIMKEPPTLMLDGKPWVDDRGTEIPMDFVAATSFVRDADKASIIVDGEEIPIYKVGDVGYDSFFKTLFYEEFTFFEYWRDGRDRPNKESELAASLRDRREKPA